MRGGWVFILPGDWKGLSAQLIRFLYESLWSSSLSLKAAAAPGTQRLMFLCSTSMHGVIFFSLIHASEGIQITLSHRAKILRSPRLCFEMPGQDRLIPNFEVFEQARMSSQTKFWVWSHKNKEERLSKESELYLLSTWEPSWMVRVAAGLSPTVTSLGDTLESSSGSAVLLEPLTFLLFSLSTSSSSSIVHWRVRLLSGCKTEEEPRPRA